MPRFSFQGRGVPVEAAATTVPGAAARPDLRRIGLRQLPALAVLLVLGWLTWDRLAALDTARIGAALASVTWAQWALGAQFTAMSFWAVGRYDAVVHRLIATPVSGGQAVRTGATAIAVAQVLGMGAFTGALVRWRLLPQLSLLDAMRVSVIVSVSFLAGWAVLAALAVLAVPLPLPGARPVAGLVLLAAGAIATLSLARPGWARALPIPSLKAMGAILGLAALDTLAAGTVLWVLLPVEIEVAPAAVLAAYLLALGAGLVLTTPGGVGPFELALLALLPGLPGEPVLAAVIAYRALYYAIPALIGGLVLLRGPATAPPAAPAPLPALDPLRSAPHLPFLVDAVIDAAPRAEAGLLRHGRLALLADRAGRPTAMAAETGQSLVLIGDPLRRDAAPGAVLALARDRAEARFLAPVFYKVGARLAVAARAGGWSVTAVAEELWLDPRDFSPDGPAHRQLRRKLRKAEAAGITITEIGPEALRPLPLDEMEEIARAWASAHRGERGFSMGTWDPAHLPWPRVCLARDSAGALLGFITIHANAREHTLDLMRARPEAPDGTMHALVAAAIAGAGRTGVARFSLAAVPLAPARGDPSGLRALRAGLERVSGAGGLRQFKAAFAPRRERLYAAAPTRAALALGALDLAREIARAAPRR
jgi:phosphatidylglycerol lysyltransferase